MPFSNKHAHRLRRLYLQSAGWPLHSLDYYSFLKLATCWWLSSGTMLQRHKVREYKRFFKPERQHYQRIESCAASRQSAVNIPNPTSSMMWWPPCASSAVLGWRKDADYPNGVPVASPVRLFSFVVERQHRALWVPLHVVDGSSARIQGFGGALPHASQAAGAHLAICWQGTSNL